MIISIQGVLVNVDNVVAFRRTNEGIALYFSFPIHQDNKNMFGFTKESDPESYRLVSEYIDSKIQ